MQNFVNIFFMKKNHIALTSWACEKKTACCHMKVSFRAMRNICNAAEYFMFFERKSKILVCLCIFYKKKFWVKNKGTILFINHFDLDWKENWLRSRGAFQEKCYDFNETAGYRGLLGLIFAGHVPLASQGPYPIIVYFVANGRPHISHFWANV